MRKKIQKKISRSTVTGNNSSAKKECSSTAVERTRGRTRMKKQGYVRLDIHLEQRALDLLKEASLDDWRMFGRCNRRVAAWCRRVLMESALRITRRQARVGLDGHIYGPIEGGKP